MMRLSMKNKLAAFWLGDRRYDGYFAPKLIGRSGFAFTNTFHLRGMQRINLLTPLVLLLHLHFRRQYHKVVELVFQPRPGIQLPSDIPYHASQTRPQELNFATR